MAGYLPSSFLRGYGPRRSPERPIPSHLLTEQLGQSIMDFIIWTLPNQTRLRENTSLGTQRIIPSGQDIAILTGRTANHSARFSSSCPVTLSTWMWFILRARGARHIFF